MQYNYAFHEICKASTMKTAVAMSKFLNTPITVEMKPIEVVSIQKINLPDHHNESTVGLFVTIDSSIVKGGSLLLSTTESALATCDLMLSRAAGYTNKISKEEESALKELANVVLGNFLTSFAHALLTKSLLHSSATYELDSSVKIARNIRLKLSNTMGENSVINIGFSYKNTHVKGDINIVLDANKINHLLKKMIALTDN